MFAFKAPQTLDEICAGQDGPKFVQEFGDVRKGPLSRASFTRAVQNLNTALDTFLSADHGEHWPKDASAQVSFQVVPLSDYTAIEAVNLRAE